MKVFVAFLAIMVWAGSWSAVTAESVVSLFEEGKRLLVTGQSGKSVELFTKALEFVEPQSRNEHIIRIARAKGYLAEGNISGSLKDIGKVLQSDSVDGDLIASALNLRGTIHRKEGRDQRAFEDFTKAIKVPHEDDALRATCFANRGVTSLSMEQPDQAISDLSKAIELNPENSYAYAWRAQAFLQQNDMERAKRDAQTALSLNPDDRSRSVAERVLKEMEIYSASPYEVSVPLAPNGHVFVQVRFSPKGKPYRFLLDTGATTTLVDKNLMEKIRNETDVVETGRGIVRVADGSTHKVIRYRVKSAYLFNLHLGPIDIAVFEKSNQRVMNLLGVGSMQNIAVSIDHSRKIAKIREVRRE